MISPRVSDEPLEVAVLSETQSLCPECLRPVRAVRFSYGQDVYLSKTCPNHGEFRTVLWRGGPSYASWTRPKEPWQALNPAMAVEKGCPFDCGLCPEHRQQTCTALIEVTQRCGMRCAFCFAGSSADAGPDPDLRLIRGWYESARSNQAHCNIQLSGGEPTVRDDLPEIVALGRSIGFEFIQLNTNGLRLAAEPAYVEKLKEAGLASVFLQFDGTTEDVHRTLRKRPLLEAKKAAIRNCRANEIGVVLVPTVVPGVNDHELGEIVQFAMENLPTVRGVHFQPVSYFGRYSTVPTDAGRITIPEVIRGLELQTEGMVSTADFAPPGCENALCSFHGTFVLMPDGGLKSFSRQAESCSCGQPKAEDGAAQTRRFVARQWSQPEQRTCCDTHESLSLGYWDVILERARTHTLAISGMAFQDAWNIDLERLKDCCIHVVARDGRLIPFCAYNLTSSSGQALYSRGDRP